MQPDQTPSQPNINSQPPQPAATPVAPAPPVAPPPATTAPVTPTASSGDSEFISNPFKLFGPSWQSIKLNLKTWIITIVVAILISAGLGVAVVAGVAMLASSGETSGSIGLIMFGLVMLVAGLFSIYAMARLAGLSTNLVIQGVRGNKLGFKQALADGKPYGWKLLGLGLLNALIIIIGFIFLIIPGLIAATWLYLSPIALVDEKLGVIAAMKRSKELVKGRFWEAFGIFSLPQIFSIFNLIPIVGFIINLLLAMAYSAAPAFRFMQLKEFTAANKPLPKVHSMNFAAIAVSMVAAFISPSASLLNQDNQPQDSLIPQSIYDEAAKQSQEAAEEGSFDTEIPESTDPEMSEPTESTDQSL